MGRVILLDSLKSSPPSSPLLRPIPQLSSILKKDCMHYTLMYPHIFLHSLSGLACTSIIQPKRALQKMKEYLWLDVFNIWPCNGKAHILLFPLSFLFFFFLFSFLYHFLILFFFFFFFFFCAGLPLLLCYLCAQLRECLRRWKIRRRHDEFPLLAVSIPPNNKDHKKERKRRGMKEGEREWRRLWCFVRTVVQVLGNSEVNVDQLLADAVSTRSAELIGNSATMSSSSSSRTCYSATSPTTSSPPTSSSPSTSFATSPQLLVPPHQPQCQHPPLCDFRD